MFTNVVGEPLQNISHYRRWKALIRDAGVRDPRLHDARHTAATTLLLLAFTVATSRNRSAHRIESDFRPQLRRCPQDRLPRRGGTTPTFVHHAGCPQVSESVGHCRRRVWRQT